MIEAALGFTVVLLHPLILAAAALLMRLQRGALACALAMTPTALLSTSSGDGNLLVEDFDPISIGRSLAWVSSLYFGALLVSRTAGQWRGLPLWSVGLVPIFLTVTFAPLVTILSAESLRPQTTRAWWSLCLLALPFVSAWGLLCFGAGARIEVDVQRWVARRRKKGSGQ